MLSVTEEICSGGEKQTKNTRTKGNQKKKILLKKFPCASSFVPMKLIIPNDVIMKPYVMRHDCGLDYSRVNKLI